MKVFIVDDSELLRERVIGLISDVENTQIVGQMETMYGSVDWIRKTQPEVLILDIHLKDGNGIEILKRIKKDPDAPTVIILTNYPYPQYRDKCEEAGAEYFLHKATEFDKLGDILRSLDEKEPA